MAKEIKHSLKGLLGKVRNANITTANIKARQQQGAANKGQQGGQNSQPTPNTPQLLPTLYGLPNGKIKDEDLGLILRMYGETLEQGTITEAMRKEMVLLMYRVAFLPAPRAEGVFHPSQIATEDNLCKRKLYYEKAQQPVDVTFLKFTSDNRMMRLVDLGTLVHLYMQENLQRVGILKDYEVKISRPDLGISGSADGIITFYGLDDLRNFYEEEDMILEVKTINDYGFKSLRGAKIEHIRQASIYGYLLGVKKICFIYYNKNTSDLKVYVKEVMADYVEDFMGIAKEVISKYNSNVRATRSKDSSKHDIFPRICGTRTSQRAMDCCYANFCFKCTN